MVSPIAAKLIQAGHERGSGVVELAVDGQPRVAGLVPTDTFVRRHRALEGIEELIGSQSRLASLEIDNAHRHTGECR